MASEGVVVPSTQSLILDLPPSCIEFCPAYPSYFVVGTYNLQKDEDAPEDGGSESAGQEDEDEQAGDAATLSSDEEGYLPQKPAKTNQSRCGSIVLFRLADDQV